MSMIRNVEYEEIWELLEKGVGASHLEQFRLEKRRALDAISEMRHRMPFDAWLKEANQMTERLVSIVSESQKSDERFEKSQEVFKDKVMGKAIPVAREYDFRGKLSLAGCARSGILEKESELPQMRVGGSGPKIRKNIGFFGFQKPEMQAATKVAARLASKEGVTATKVREVTEGVVRQVCMEEHINSDGEYRVFEGDIEAFVDDLSSVMEACAK